MTRVTSRTVTITRREYRVPSPCTWRDVHDAIALALSDLPEGTRTTDDACHVRAEDEEIVVWWETRDPAF